MALSGQNLVWLHGHSISFENLLKKPELECQNCRGLRLEISVLAATQRQSFSTVAGKKGPKIVNVVCERPHRLHYANGSFFIIQLPLFFFKWNAFSVLFLFYSTGKFSNRLTQNLFNF